MTTAIYDPVYSSGWTRTNGGIYCTNSYDCDTGILTMSLKFVTNKDGTLNDPYIALPDDKAYAIYIPWYKATLNISDNYTNEYVEQNNCKRIVYLGSGSTYDLSSYDGYTSFTNSNFIVGITSGGIGCDTYMAGNGNRYSYSVKTSYNSSTGKLTISVGGSSSVSSGCCAFYSFSANYNVYLIY